VSDIDTAVVDSLKALDPERPIREADNPVAPAFVRYWTRADNGGFWPAMVCPLLTQLRHWLCTAAIILMPVSASIEVLV
jgi:hypothetical protein